MESHWGRLSTWDHPQGKEEAEAQGREVTRSKTKSQVRDPDKPRNPEVGVGPPGTKLWTQVPAVCPHPKALPKGRALLCLPSSLRSQYHGEALGCGPCPLGPMGPCPV